MPLPSPRGKEKRSDFVSRCVSSLSKKGEGKNAKQRVAICNTQFRKAKAGEILYQEEAEAIANVMNAPEFNSGGPVINLNRKEKKKKKDKFRLVDDEESGSSVTGEEKKKEKKKDKKKPKMSKDY